MTFMTTFKMITEFVWSRETIILLIAIGAVIAVIFLRNFLATLLIRILFHKTRKRDRERYNLTKAVLRTPVACLIITAVLRGALDYFTIPEKYFEFSANLTESLFMVCAFWLLYSASGLAAANFIQAHAAPDGKEAKVSQTAVQFITNAIQFAIVAIGLLMVLSRWVSDISGLIAGLGIGGLAIALAAQDTAGNLFGSIAIMLDKPFEIGDTVEVEGFLGTVERIGLRSSRIRLVDQAVVSIPNGRLASSSIVNGACRTKRRVAFKLGLRHATPVDQIKTFIERIKAILESDPDVEKETYLVCLDEFSDSSIDIFILYYTQMDYAQMMLIKERINYAILQASMDAGVSIELPSVRILQKK